MCSKKEVIEPVYTNAPSIDVNTAVVTALIISNQDFTQFDTFSALLNMSNMSN